MAQQLFWLFILPIPIACIAWTFTHEEIFREIHEYCVSGSKKSKTLFRRKIFYMLTCEYCFSHYVTIGFLIVTGYKLLMDNWVGYVIAGFAVVWIANIYMSLYAFLRSGMKKERIQANIEEKEFQEWKN